MYDQANSTETLIINVLKAVANGYDTGINLAFNSKLHSNDNLTGEVVIALRDSITELSNVLVRLMPR